MVKLQSDIHTSPTRQGITAKEIPWKWIPSLVFTDSLPAAVILVTIMTLRRFGMSNADITFYIAIICLPLILRPWARLLTKRIIASPKVWMMATQLVGATSLWARGIYAAKQRVETMRHRLSHTGQHRCCSTLGHTRQPLHRQ